MLHQFEMLLAKHVLGKDIDFAYNSYIIFLSYLPMNTAIIWSLGMVALKYNKSSSGLDRDLN